MTKLLSHAVIVVIALTCQALNAFGQPIEPQTPTQPFDDATPPPVPDYTDPASWAALPDRADAADGAPAGAAIADGQADAAADVFYIHPTTYRGAQWNQDIALEDVNIWTDISVVARQASAFNGCCRVFAPRYRQATIAALGQPELGGMKAYNLAYQDVRAAFRHYLDVWNDGRPFIIASHSQGSLHAERLLREELNGSPVAERMIAAYVTGYPIHAGAFDQGLSDFAPCHGATDVHCIASWSTFTRDGDTATYIARTQQRYRASTGQTEGEAILCWNPVGETDSESDIPADMNIGALPGKPDQGPLPALRPGQGAQCQGGPLVTDIPDDPAFDILRLPGGNLHFHDIDLFYGNIRANAVARTNAYLNAPE